MSAEQQCIDADTLGQMVHQAMVRQVIRDGWSEEATTQWDGLDDTARGEFRAVALAVARVVLSAAVAHLRADLEWTRGRTRGETVRHVLDGYEDAIDELTTFAKQAGLEAGK